MVFCSMAANAVENFINSNSRENFNDGKMTPLGTVIFLAIYLTLVLMLGKYLWNEVAVKVLTIAKPMPSVLHLLGLVLLVDLILPNMSGCNCM